MNNKKIFGGLARIILGTALALAPVSAENHSNYSINFKQDNKGNQAVIYDYKVNTGGNLYALVEFAKISMDFNSEGFSLADNQGWVTEGYNADIMKITEPDGTVMYLEDIGVDLMDLNAMPDGKIEYAIIYPSEKLLTPEEGLKKKTSLKRVPKIYLSPEESLIKYQEEMKHFQKIFEEYKAIIGLEGTKS